MSLRKKILVLVLGSALAMIVGHSLENNNLAERGKRHGFGRLGVLIHDWKDLKNNFRGF